MEDKLSFLSGNDPVEPIDAPVVDTTPDPAPEPSQDGQPRDGQGRFTSAADPVPAPQPDPVVDPAQPQAPPEPQPEPGHVPLSVVKDERERRQAAERELEALRKQHAPKPQPVEPQPIPDQWEDPEGFQAYQAQQQQAFVLNVKLDLSEDMARGKHGDELVEQAKAWAIERFGQSPAYYQEVISHRNPYEKAVQDFQRHALLEGVKPDEIEQFRAWKAAQANPNPTPAPLAPAPAPAPPNPPPKTPPRSIAAAPSAGGPAHVPSGPGMAFGAMFSKG